MHSRDITILIVLLWFSIVHHSSLFQYFFLSICYRLYSSRKFLIFSSLLTFFANSNIDRQMNPRILHPHTSIISESEVSITVFCLPCSPRYIAVQIKNCSKSTSVIKVATMKIRWCCIPQLLSETEVSIA